MSTTKISANVLASGAALTNINAGSTIDFTKNVSRSGILTVDILFSIMGYSQVGIGTTTPTSPLDVVGRLSLRRTSGGGELGYFEPTAYGNAGLLFINNIWCPSISVPSGSITLGTGGSNTANTILRANGIDTLIINGSTNNVGIGTTTPSEKLTVVGNISASGTVTGTNLVYNTTDQTIAGSKTFSNDTVINGGLTINSTTRGIYIPRLTTVQRDALSTPSDGLMIYESTRSNIQTYNSTLASWQNAVNSSSIRTMVSLTRSDYNALSSKDSETFYIITDDPVSSPTVYPLYSTSVDYSITDADTVILVTANSPTITLPSSTTLTGRVYYIKNRSTLSCTLSTTASESIDGLSSIPIAPNNSIQTISTGSGWIIL